MFSPAMLWRKFINQYFHRPAIDLEPIWALVFLSKPARFLKSFIVEVTPKL